MEYISFIVTTKDGRRLTYSTTYVEGDESEIDAAWDEVRMVYPDASYIEKF